jgi:LacI family transcriptional regulator
MARMTIEDVARAARCSTATVSLVLNNRGRVAEKTRKRVLKAQAELGYVPNPAGRSLRMQRTNMVGLLFYPSCAKLFRNVFYAEVMEGLEEELSKAGYDLLLSGGDLAADEAQMPAFLQQRRVDAAVLLGAFPRRRIEAMAEKGVPLLMLDSNHEDLPVDSITTDGYSAGRLIVDHLVARGHRRLLFMAYAMEDFNIDARVRGFEAGLRAHGLPVEGAVERGFIGRVEACDRLLARLRGAHAPTAVVAVNDTLAVELMARMREERVKLPAELSFVGFDDDVYAQEIVPRLTTIGIDKPALGREGARILIERLREPARPVVKLRLPVRLIERDSVARV